jgi:DNA-binding CsgD family transcriptional regulator
MNILDQFSVGIILLDRCAKVVFANAAARSLTGAGSPLRLRETGIASSSAAHARRLSALIQSAVAGAPACAMSFPADDGRRLMALISSVQGADQGALVGQADDGAAAMLLLSDCADRKEIPAPWIMHAFGLTSAEARVALSTATGASVPDTARRLKIAPSTVRTHLRGVFAKTGTHRQADLARLIASVGLLQADGPCAQA